MFVSAVTSATARLMSSLRSSCRLSIIVVTYYDWAVDESPMLRCQRWNASRISGRITTLGRANRNDRGMRVRDSGTVGVLLEVVGFVQ
jgi:hypothetical protein